MSLNVITIVINHQLCMWVLKLGRTPLHAVAASLFRQNEQVVNTLIKAGADVNTTDEVIINLHSVTTS